MITLLFLCTRNSCRSQMAEGFARTRAPRDVEVFSAGTEASRVHPMAIRVMQEAGLDISNQRSKSIGQLGDRRFDIVITLCDQAAEACPFIPGHPVRINWDLPDPDAGKGGEAAALPTFRQARDRIRQLVDDFYDRGYLAALTDARQSTHLIVDNLIDGLIAHDMNRNIFYFNKAAETITGYTAAEVLNRDCHAVFSGGFCGGQCALCEHGEAPVPFGRLEITITTKSGENRLVEMNRKEMTDSSGHGVGALVSFRDLTRERALARRVGEAQHRSGIIGRDKQMLAVLDLVSEVADATVPVLIQGESGTGKELVAAAIHNESPRANRLFVPVNCGALPEGLLETELFGHVKGSFTGAIRDKKGRFELADGGTIFLDEIGDISPAMQIKLLRVLQEGTFERVGSEKTVKVDVRVISATNKDLQKELGAGRFREDLYYRLNVVPIFLPPLRERRNDIPLLVEYLLKQILESTGKPVVTVAPETLDIMMGYDWPGNVRELQNWLQFALVKCRGPQILPTHLPPGRFSREMASATAPPVVTRRRQLDMAAVREAIQRTGGNKVEAARLLGVSRATLYRFLDEQH